MLYQTSSETRMTNSYKPGSEKVTVIIPNWNGMKWLDDCLSSLKNQDLPYFQTTIVDNGSNDDSVQFIKKNYSHINIIELPYNMGFAKAVNIGIEKSTTPYIAILNTDTIVYSDWLSNLLNKIENSPPDIAAINPKMLCMDDCNKIDDAGDELSWYGIATKRGHNELASAYCEEVEVFSPSGGASIYRKDFLNKTGGFDASFFAYLEDVDLGLRGRLMGYRYLYLPTAKVQHKSHGSGIQLADHVKLLARNRLLLFVKNIPASLLFKYAFKLIYGQIYFFVVHGRIPHATLKGYWLFMMDLPKTLKKRKQQLNKLKINHAEIKSIIHSRTPNPPLSHLFKGFFMDLIHKFKFLK